MKLLTTVASLLLALLVSSLFGGLLAQTRRAPVDSDLFKTMASLDRALFDAYNACELETFGTFFVDDVEFYHDKGGVTLGRKQLVESVKNNICGKVRRELVPASVEVYPMDGYGALQSGAHLFSQSTPKPCEGIGKFIHLWQHKDGAWKITRAVSYDHRPNQ